MKSFENYTNLGNCRINDVRHTQWEKKYDDGLTAKVTIKTSGMTRKKVRDAFNEQEIFCSEHGNETYLSSHI